MGLCAFYALQLLMNSRKSHCLSMRLNYQASVGIYLKVCSSYFLCLIYYILAVETLQSTILRFLTLWTLLYSVIILFECFVWKVCYDYFIWIVLNGLSENFPLNSMIVFFLNVCCIASLSCIGDSCFCAMNDYYIRIAVNGLSWNMDFDSTIVEHLIDHPRLCWIYRIASRRVSCRLKSS